MPLNNSPFLTAIVLARLPNMCFTECLAMLFSECEVLLRRQRSPPLPPLSLFRARNGSYFQLFWFALFLQSVLIVCFVLMCLGGSKAGHFFAFNKKHSLCTPQKWSLSLALFSLVEAPGRPRTLQIKPKCCRSVQERGSHLFTKKRVVGNKCIKNDFPGDTKNLIKTDNKS